jgi:WD40 repeat protein
VKVLQIFGSSSSLRIVALTVAALALGSNHFAQRRRTAPIVTSLTDVVNAMQFSPDSRTLAIARGSRDDNRVELWNTETGKLRRTIRGFDGQIWSVSFSPDGKTLVTGSGGMHQEKVAQKPLSHNGRPFTELKWWDPQTGDLKQRVELRDEELVSVAAVHSPNGRLLAAVENRLSMRMASFDDLGPLSRDPMTRVYPMRPSGMFDSDLRLLDAANGEVRLKLKDGFTNSQFPMFGETSRADFLSDFLPYQPSAAIAFSPDGQLVAAWNASEIRLWNSSTGSEVLKIKKFKGRLTAVAFSPDGRLIAGAIVKFSFKDRRPDYKSEIRIWEAATGAPRQVVPLATQSVSSLIFAGNGQQLLVGGLQSEADHSFASMELADLQTGSLGKLIAKDEGTMSSICVSPDGATMAFQTDASTVKLLETQGWRTKFTLSSDDEASSSNTSLRRFLVTVNSTSAVAFLDDGKTIAGEIENGGIKLWDSRTGEVKKILAQEAETGSMAAISANGSAIAEVAPDDSVRLWNLETGKHRIIPARNSKVSAIALSADGKVLATAYASAIVWTDAGDLKATRALEGVSDVSALAVSMNATLLAASSNGAIKIWNTDGSLKQNISAGGEVTALQFGTQDQFLAVGRKDGNVSVWNLQNGQLVFEARKHTSAVNAIAFSTDGMLMATGSDDRTAIIWDLASRRARRTLKGHDLAITSLAFSPDGATLAVGSGNASVVLWEVEKGRLDRVLK